MPPAMQYAVSTECTYVATPYMHARKLECMHVCTFIYIQTLSK